MIVSRRHGVLDVDPFNDSGGSRREGTIRCVVDFGDAAGTTRAIDSIDISHSKIEGTRIEVVEPSDEKIMMSDVIAKSIVYLRYYVCSYPAQVRGRTSTICPTVHAFWTMLIVTGGPPPMVSIWDSAGATATVLDVMVNTPSAAHKPEPITRADIPAAKLLW
jgi:hypothetical protein